MIRLLENSDSKTIKPDTKPKRHEVDTGLRHTPAIGNMSGPEVHLREMMKIRCRLLAGGAHIHVDFHADRHFDDFRCFPGHLALLFEPDELRPRG